MYGKDKIVAGLRELADWLEATDEATVGDWTQVRLDNWYGNTKEAVLALAQSGGNFEKKYYGDTMVLVKSFSEGAVTYEMNVNREEVCTKRVVGTKIEKQRDPELVKAIPYVEVEVEEYEWDCHPLLGE